MPEVYDANNYLININDPNQIQICKHECKFLEYPCCKDVYDLCKIVMEENNMYHHSDPFSCVDLYIALRIKLHEFIYN